MKPNSKHSNGVGLLSFSAKFYKRIGKSDGQAGKDLCEADVRHVLYERQEWKQLIDKTLCLTKDTSAQIVITFNAGLNFLLR